MSRGIGRLGRLILRAYPCRFRRQFGEEMLRLLEDRRRFEQVPAWRLVLGEITDAVRVAPRLRWEESIMNRLVIVTMFGTVAVAAAIAFGPFVLIPVGFALAAAVVAVRRDRPVAASRSRRSRAVLLVAAVVSLVVGVTLVATADGELSEPAWAVAAISVLIGVGSTIALLLLKPGRTDMVSTGLT